MQLSIGTSPLITSRMSSEASQPEPTFGFAAHSQSHFKTFTLSPLRRGACIFGTASLSLLLWMVTLQSAAAATSTLAPLAVTQVAGSAKSQDTETLLATAGAGTGDPTPSPAPLIYADAIQASSTTSPAYTISLIYNQPANDYVRGINDSGQVVGYFGDNSNPDGYTIHAFVWSNAEGIKFLKYGTDDIYGTYAFAINNAGHIAGAVSPSVGPEVPVYWNASDGTSQTLPSSGAGAAYAINTAGCTAGYCNGGYPGAWYTSGTLLAPSWNFTSGTFTGINDGLILCGQLNNYSGVGGSLIGIRYDALAGIQTQLLPPGFLNFVPTGINENGDIVGSGQLPSYASIAGYIDAGGTFHQVSTEIAKAINNSDEIIGVDTNGNPYVWTPSQGLTNLQTAISPGSGWTLKTADALNNLGQIVGTGTYNGVPAIYLLTPAISETAFTLTPNQLSAAGPNVTATVTSTGPVQSVTITCQSGALNGVAAPTYNLVQNGNTWTGTLPTSFLKLAAFNPTTFIATATGLEGSTAVQSASLLVGSEPWLTLSLNTDKLDVPAGNTFKLQGVIGDYTPSSALVSVSIPIPPHTTFVNSPDFVLNTTSNTLTWTGQLAAVNGSHTIAIEFQTNITTTPGTVIPLSATATAPRFQNITKSTLLLVGPAPTPVGIAIDDSGADGQATGSYTITSPAGASTLTATIAPVSYLQHSWLGVDEAYNAGGGPLSPTTNISIGTALADLGLVAPGASPTYCASFSNVGSQCEIRLKLTPQAALMNIANITFDLLGGILNQKLDPESLINVVGALQTIDAFNDAEQALLAPSPSAFARAQHIAQAANDVLNISADDLAKLAPIASRIFNRSLTPYDLQGAFHVLSVGEAILDIGEVVSDEIIFTSSLSGADANVTYTATATAQQ